MSGDVIERHRCSHCGRRRQCWPWGVRMCADGSKKRDGWLCYPCDKALNAHVLRFFNVAGWRAKVKVYRW